MSQTQPPSPMRVPDIAGLLARGNRQPAVRARLQPDVLTDGADNTPASETAHVEKPDLVTGTSIESPQQAVRRQAPSQRVKKGIEEAALRSVPSIVASPSRTPEIPSDAPPAREYLRMITVHLPRSIHQVLAVYAAEQGITRTMVILQAVDSRHQDLGPALAQQQQATEGNLFPIKSGRASNDPLVEVKIRVTDRQLAAIQWLVQDHATSRSKLISTALQLYLPAYS